MGDGPPQYRCGPKTAGATTSSVLFRARGWMSGAQLGSIGRSQRPPAPHPPPKARHAHCRPFAPPGNIRLAGSARHWHLRWQGAVSNAGTVRGIASEFSYDIITRGDIYNDEDVAGQTFELVHDNGDGRVQYDPITEFILFYENDDTTGEWSLLHSRPSLLADVQRLQMETDDNGDSFLLVLGTNGAASVEVIPVTSSGNFDGSSWSFTTPALRNVEEILRDGTDRLIAWSLLSQRAINLTLDGAGRPTAATPDTVLLAPMGITMASLNFAAAAPDAVGTLAGDSRDQYSVHFNDDDGDGVYTCVMSDDATRLADVPSFGEPPVATENVVWVTGVEGHKYGIVTHDGTSESLLGWGTFGSRRTRAYLTFGSFTAGHVVQLRNTHLQTNSLWVPVGLQARPTVLSTIPRFRTSTGGAVLIRGSHFDLISDVRVGGHKVGFNIESSTMLRLNVPSGLPNGPHTIDADGRSLGSLMIKSGSYDAFVGAELTAALSVAGTGWQCGTVLATLGDAPFRGPAEGCVFNSAGAAGTLSTGWYNIGAAERGVVRLLHRMDFGEDGDGLVVMASDGLRRIPLRRLDRPQQIVHGNNCQSTTCPPDPDFAGFAGVAVDAQVEGWHIDEFEIPAGASTTGQLKIQLGVMDISSTDSADYRLAMLTVEIGPEFPTALSDRYGWDDVRELGMETDYCESADDGDGSAWGCLTPGDAGYPSDANGAVFQWHGEGQGWISFDISSAIGARQVRARVRTRAEFSAGNSFNGGSGHIELCCDGNCDPVEPVNVTCRSHEWSSDGFLASMAVRDSTIDDQDSESTMSEYTYDATPDPGASSCSLRLRAEGYAESGVVGWLVDDITVESR